MNLVDRLAAKFASHKPVAQKMFGGVCFMINGNMAAGTSKQGLLIRVGKEAHADALKLPGATPMEMRGRVMAGYVFLDEAAVESDAALDRALAMALGYVETLPAKAKKAAKPKK